MIDQTFNSLRPGHAARTSWWWRALLLVLLVLLGSMQAARAQGTPFKDEQLDQMLAPVALYPDALLAQVLMAATYPSDVNEAAAWSRANSKLSGDEAVKRVTSKGWEASVQSLVAFPQVLAMMDAHPAQAQALGDAFLEDASRVMARVQVLRAQASAAGSLKTTSQQTIIVQTTGSTPVIVIEPTQQTVVYVPLYQPSVVYGTWGYPAYPPYYWAPPPAYAPPGNAFVAGFFWGFVVRGITHSLWGGFRWDKSDVNINVNHYNSIHINKRINVNQNVFVHNPARRGKVPYHDERSRQAFGPKALAAVKDRDAARPANKSAPIKRQAAPEDDGPGDKLRQRAASKGDEKDGDKPVGRSREIPAGHLDGAAVGQRAAEHRANRPDKP
jgi:hypothetical protein